MATGLLLGLILAMRLFPETPFARLLHLHLIERPVEQCARFERRHIIFIALACAILLFSAEMIGLFGSFDLALAYAWDVSLYLDVLAISGVVAGATQVKAAWRGVKGWGQARPRHAIRFRRTNRRDRARVRPNRKLSADDEEGEPLALAA